MSGLLDSLSAASNALNAQTMGMDVVSQNIANVNTPGYTRRTLTLAETPPVGASNIGGGVTVTGVSAARDTYVESSIRDQSSTAARNGTVSDSLTVIETALGQPGASLDASITSFYDAWSGLASDPSSPSARDAVVQQGQVLATNFNALAGQLTSAQQDADAQVRGSVDQVNRLTGQIASLNAQITAPNGANVEGLKDQRTLALGTLAGLVNIQTTEQADGGVNVMVGQGRLLVAGSTNYAMGLDTTGANGFAQVTANGQTITSELTGGSMGGAIAVRDTLIPGYQQQLDQLAFDFGTQVNAEQHAGFDATGTAGADFFTLPGSQGGAAAAITVDPGLAANSQLVAASATGTVGDNQNALAVAASRDQQTLAGGTASAMQLWSQLVYTVGADTVGAQSAQSASQSVVDQLTKLRDATSAVSIDQEATSLMQYQRAYEASAKYFSVVNATLDALMNMVT